MVKLPKEGESGPKPNIVMLVWENYQWYLRTGPENLLQLEELADMTATYMRIFRMHPNVTNIRQFTMDRLRRLFNMEFKLRCHECGTAHYQDEITAPER